MSSSNHRVKYAAIKTFWFFARPLLLTYWFVRRPHTRGVKCVITHTDGSRLFVRLNYGKRYWTFPGGGVNRGESLVAAAARELREETGVAVPTLTEVFTYQNRTDYKHNTVTVFSGTTDSKEVSLDPIEIAECGWFTTENLPSPLAPSVTTILNSLKT